MTNTMRINAQYDVKNEIGGEMMRWLDQVYDIKDSIGSDWDGLDPLQKICLYWLMGNICASSEIRLFDCDSSDYSKQILDEFPVRREAENLAEFSDTLTSAWSPLKKFLGLSCGKKTGTYQLLSGEGDFAKTCRARLEKAGAMDFLEVSHTIGNFMPVPRGFNCARTGYTGAPDYLAAYDQTDLCLMAIKEYYDIHTSHDPNRDQTISDTDPLRKLFCLKSRDEGKREISYAKAWLDHFGCWRTFVEKNMLLPMVDENYLPIPFFPGHSLERPYPDNDEDWKTFFSTAARLIRERSEHIVNSIAKRKPTGVLYWRSSGALTGPLDMAM